MARTPPAAAWTPIIDLDIGSGARDGSSVGGDRGRRQPLLEMPHLAAEPSGSGSGSSQPDAISPLISSSARDAAMLLMHGELNQAFRVADAIDFDDALGLVEIGLDVTFADAQLASGRVGALFRLFCSTPLRGFSTARSASSSPGTRLGTACSATRAASGRRWCATSARGSTGSRTSAKPIASSVTVR